MICVRRTKRIPDEQERERERQTENEGKREPTKKKCAPRYAIMSMQKNIVDYM